MLARSANDVHEKPEMKPQVLVPMVKSRRNSSDESTAPYRAAGAGASLVCGLHPSRASGCPVSGAGVHERSSCRLCSGVNADADASREPKGKAKEKRGDCMALGAEETRQIKQESDQRQTLGHLVVGETRCRRALRAAARSRGGFAPFSSPLPAVRFRSATQGAAGWQAEPPTEPLLATPWSILFADGFLRGVASPGVNAQAWAADPPFSPQVGRWHACDAMYSPMPGMTKLKSASASCLRLGQRALTPVEKKRNEGYIFQESGLTLLLSLSKALYFGPLTGQPRRKMLVGPERMTQWHAW